MSKLAKNIKIFKEVSEDNMETVTITIPKQLETKELAILKEHGLTDIDEAIVDLETGILTLTVAFSSYYKGDW